MLDFSMDGVPQVGIIDWGLELHIEYEKWSNNIINTLDERLWPWHALKLLEKDSTFPWSQASDMYALA